MPDVSSSALPAHEPHDSARSARPRATSTAAVPNAAVGASTPTPRAARPRARGPWILAAITVLLAAINLSGARYYALPIAERVRSPLHSLLRPSGAVGQSAGVLAVAIFVFLWLYPLRKRWRWLAFTGSVGRWLDVHIVAALTLPLLLAIHAAWRFGGVIGLGFWAMMIVCASGVVGRYLYVRIPRSRTGAELSLEDVAGQRRALIQRIVDATGLELDDVQALTRTAASSTSAASPWRALRAMVAYDLTRWRLRRDIERRWQQLAPHVELDRRTLDEVASCAAREMALAQQVAMLGTTHRIFRLWHIAHRPIALTALIAVVIHVTVVVALGVTWFW